ncbi:MAG TPA: hypothetical protein VGQ38_13565 [Gaiellaceae bacterium]|nr:hypothetical protein [Gaiellaceae bacterium]
MNDVITRLAAANPVPAPEPLDVPKAAVVRPRRIAIAIALAVAIAVPATAFAGKLGDLLGITNGGTAVPASSVLPGETKLDAALTELKVGGTMQSLGTLNGVAFYATRNSDGDFCFAMVRIDGQVGKGFGCDLNADNFPSAQVQALTFPELTRLQGLAADGVATVQALDANGKVLDATPVENNMFASTIDVPAGAATAIRTLDANGHITATEQLPQGNPQPANTTVRSGQPTNK